MESSTGDGGYRRRPRRCAVLGRPLRGISWSQALGLISRFGSSNKRTIKILKDVSGIIKPSRMTLLLGPPASGKSTLMRALTGKPAKNLKMSGNITYCGHTFSEFYPERTSAYVSQYDLHYGEMTVRETMDFSRRCLGIGARYDMLSELARRERNAGIKPDPEIDALMKATAVEGKETNIMTDLILKVLGLDICADIIVGDEMKRGISGGQKKRVTTAGDNTSTVVADDDSENELENDSINQTQMSQVTRGTNGAANRRTQTGMILPFQPLALSFNHMNYYVDMPAFMANVWKQFRSYWKNPPYNAMRYLMTALYAIVFGTVFWRKGKNVENQEDLVNLLGATYAAVFFLGAANLLSCLPVFSIERTVFYRENAAGMYSPLSYAFALTVVEMVYNIAQGILYTLPIYAMIGYEWKADKFFYFLFFISACFLYFTMFGAMLIACTPSQMLANILVSFALTGWNIFAGFLIARPAIPVWWRWFYWADPVSWTIYGVTASQFGNVGDTVKVPGSATGIVVKDFLDRNLGYKHDFVGYVLLAHFGYILLFVFLFAYGTKALNFQKR
ncbi:hypothetical protein EJB05_12214, partial [Eragrostis curvula]